jgi:hypothetical protein
LGEAKLLPPNHIESDRLSLALSPSQATATMPCGSLLPQLTLASPLLGLDALECVSYLASNALVLLTSKWLFVSTKSIYPEDIPIISGGWSLFYESPSFC